MFERRFRKTVVGAALLSISGFAAGWGCPPVIDSVWQAGVTAAQTTISGGILGMAETLAATRLLNLERVLSAIRVLAKQVSTTAEQQVATDIAAKKGAASYLSELSTRKAIFNTMVEYSAATGQGFDPCGELKRTQNIAVAIGEANRDLQEKVIRELDSAPGRVVRDQAAVINQRMSTAKSLYCTEHEAAMGLCSRAGVLAGKDVDASNFFASYHVDAPENRAKSALLNNMYGIPYQTIPRELAATPSGQAFLEAKRNEDAIRSVSQASMKAIQSWTEARGNGSVGSDSVLDALGKKVGTYAGGTNYDAWERDKMTQSERGLLVEYAKMAAAELYMLHMEYQQYERMEANIAAWQALQARRSVTGEQYAQAAAARAKVR